MPANGGPILPVRRICDEGPQMRALAELVATAIAAHRIWRSAGHWVPCPRQRRGGACCGLNVIYSHGRAARASTRTLRHKGIILMAQWIEPGQPASAFTLVS